ADNPTRLALISSKFDTAIVLDVTEKTMSAMAKEAFHFAADRTSAKSDAGIEMQPVGKFTRIDGPIYSFAVNGLPVLFRPHPGYVGELTFDKLWETVPVWRAEMEAYTPDAKAVAALKAIDKDAQVTLIFGTWCGDSKYYVPRLLRALKEAANSRLHVKLVGIDNQFHEPVDTVQPRQLTNVPTIIVERDGREVGRVVEPPAVDSIEQDLVDLLNGKPSVHKARGDRGPKVPSGIIQQTLEVPEAFSIWSQSVAADGLRLADVKSAEPYKAACYVAPAEFDSAMGTMAAMTIESKGDEAVRVPAGEFRARHFVRKSDRGASHLWLHPQLGVPVRGEINGVAFTLTALEVAPPAK